MDIKNEYTIITDKGNTADIIKAVMAAYDIENDVQIERLAHQLKGKSEYQTCINIWNYLVQNIRYKADTETQEIRTPARLVHDGSGDCKSYSIFTATILRYLKIPHYFRFTSYDSRKEATHVYVVALINNKQIPIDAVAYVQQRIDFGNEVKYTYKADMKDRTTKIAYVSGINDNYAIGNMTLEEAKEYLKSERFQVWLDNENESTIRLAKGYLLSLWDMYWTEYGISKTEANALEALNKLEYVATMIALYNEYYSDDEMLNKIGKAISYLIKNGSLNSNELNPDNRAFFNDNTIDYVKSLLPNSDKLPYSAEFMKEWEENVINQNFNATDDNNQPMSIGAVTSLRDDFKSTGPYYLYSYISESQKSKYGQKVYQKRMIQNKQISLNNTNLKSKISVSEQSNLIYSGSCSFFEDNPSNVINDLACGKSKITGIGVIEIVTSVIMAICGIIAAIFKKNTTQTLSEATVAEGAMSALDWNPNSSSGTGSGSGNSIVQSTVSWLLPVALIGGLLFSQLKKDNKKKDSGKKQTKEKKS